MPPGSAVELLGLATAQLGLAAELLGLAAPLGIATQLLGLATKRPERDRGCRQQLSRGRQLAGPVRGTEDAGLQRAARPQLWAMAQTHTRLPDVFDDLCVIAREGATDLDVQNIANTLLALAKADTHRPVSSRASASWRARRHRASTRRTWPAFAVPWPRQACAGLQTSRVSASQRRTATRRTLTREKAPVFEVQNIGNTLWIMAKADMDLPDVFEGFCDMARDEDVMSSTEDAFARGRDEFAQPYGVSSTRHSALPEGRLRE